MKNVFTLITLVLSLLLSGISRADESEPYNKVLDKLTSVKNFSDRPVLFVIGFDTSKSMSVEFDTSKKLIQTILSRYCVPGDSIYIFGFADKASVLPATTNPKSITSDGPDAQLASINESLLSLPRSNAQGTVFGRAKLFALEKMEQSKDANVIVLLFSDNNSEIEMGVDERKRLKTLEDKVATNSETLPLYSQGVSRLWLTIYTNSFPSQTALVGPPPESQKLENPRLAWAAKRAGSQTLEFLAPAQSVVEVSPIEVAVQFLGTSEPKSATLTIDGKDALKTTFDDGKATWTIPNLESGSHLLFVQAVLADGKVRTAEKQITFHSIAVSPTPIASATPITGSTPVETPPPKGSGGFPFVPLVVILALGGVAYFLSLKPIKIRVIGPDREESFLVPKGKSIRVGGTARVESDLVYRAEQLTETIASVQCLAFGKAKILMNTNLRQGNIDIETDEGYSVGESGEPLLTSATITYADEKGRKQVFTLVKEDASGPNAEGSGHFGAGTSSGEETSTDGGDWRS